jgi:hypothetical protein
MNIQQLSSWDWPFKFYFNLLNVILIQLYKKKEVRGMGKSFLANIPPPTCEKSGLELCLAQDAGPLGNLEARQADRQASCLSGNGESATSERESWKRT